MTTSLATLLYQETKARLFATGLAIAESIGLPVTTWQAGDPSRALLHYESEVLEALEQIVVGYIRSGFLDFAAELALENPEDPKAQTWLRIVAEQVFGVEVPEATYATSTLTLTNSLGYQHDIEPGRLTVRSSLTQKTYHNTTGGTLAPGPGSTLTISIEADEPGADSSASATEIDELVTTLTGVTCSNPTAAVGRDEQSPLTTVQQCRDKLDSLSPNGPKGAYAYVARNRSLTGTDAVTRVRTYPDSDTGEVEVYVASASGVVTSPDLDLVEAAILQWATPLCITPTVESASPVVVPIGYELWVYKSVNKTADEVQEDVEAALEDLFAELPIGGDVIPPALTGAIYHSKIESTIRETHPQIFRVLLTTPAGDTALGRSDVAVLGTITGVIHIVVDPS